MLGMIEIHGSATSSSILKIVEEKVAEYGLHLDQIVAIITDGASVMKKIGCQILCELLLC